MKESILDTDIISFYLKGDQNVVENVFKYLEEFPTLSLSTISYFEVLAGLEYKKATKKIKAFKEFTSNCTILIVDKSSLELSAKKYGELRRDGRTIGHSDLLIAGIAIKNKLILVSNNTKHFKGIKGLKLANWKV